MQEVGIGLGQALFGGDGDNLPVGLVHIHQHVGVGGVVLGAGQVFGQGGHLVGIDDLAAGKQGLFHRHGRRPDIVQVGMQGVVNLGANRVHGIGDVGNQPGQALRIHALQHLQHRLPHGAGHVFGRQGGIGLDGGHKLSHALTHLRGERRHGPRRRGIEFALHQGAGVAQKGRLVLADKGHVAVII